MLRKTGLVCAMIALFSIAGGQWAVLQSVAWAQMLYGYSQQAGGSLKVALVETFDGQHPCALCRDIQSARQAQAADPAHKNSSREQQPPQSIKAEKNNSLFSGEQEIAALAVNRCTGERAWPTLAGPRLWKRAEQPPAPPPRAA